MKNYLVLFTLLITINSFGQTVLITRVIDGKANDDCTAAGTLPIVIELYVKGTINFSTGIGYNLDIETNGSSDGTITGQTWNPKSISSLGTVTDSFVYITPNTSHATMLYAMTDKASVVNTVEDAANWLSGNDAIRIMDENGTVLDQFGDPNDSNNSAGDHSAPWDYYNSYSKRNNGSIPNEGIYNSTNWELGGTNLWENGATCVTMKDLIDFGNFTTIVMSVAKNDIENFTIYPNPIQNEFRINTSTLGNTKKSIQIYNTLGKQVYLNKTVYNNEPINVSALSTGIYFLKVNENNKSATRKLIIK